LTKNITKFGFLTQKETFSKFKIEKSERERERTKRRKKNRNNKPTSLPSRFRNLVEREEW
jgi:hypothetical protein